MKEKGVGWAIRREEYGMNIGNGNKKLAGAGRARQGERSSFSVFI
jgi:hypothetical protein